MHLEDLPPLNLLPAFEAAGRLGSFKAAAAQLHLTPSAISQQIKALEEALGTVLFERRGRAVVLTHEGERYLSEVRQLLSELASASRRMRHRSEGTALRLSTVDFVAYEFLLPRLSAFRAHFPGRELRIEASMQLVSFDSSDVDVAIRVGGGPWPGLVATRFGDVIVTPICSPKLAAQIHTEADLFEQTLIELRGQEHRGWYSMVRARGRSAPQPQILTFEGYFETVRAAEQGLGVAYGLFPMTSEWVASGRLAVPLAMRMPLPGHICLVHRAADEGQPLLTRFAAWLRTEYAGLPPLPKGRVVPGESSTRRRRRAAAT